ncbi:MAG: hypothetical protein WBA74_10435 [Cyclobacteriaceae bacterium]
MSRKYPRKDDPKLNDLNMLWDEANSYWTLTSFSNMLALYQANLVFPDAGKAEADTQYSSPTITGFSVQVNDNNKDTHLILQLSLALAAGTIVFPLNTNLRDKQIITINTTNQITALTLDKNGASGLYGDISSMGADDYVSYKYDIITNAWFRIG